MGAHQSSSNTGIGAHSTAKEIIDFFGEGRYLDGKTAIVTGGNSGIGLETCKALASAGARVILCSRSIKSGENALEEEIKKPGLGGYSVESPNVIVKQLDLSSLKSIKDFADDFNKNEKRLDFLVLNAGIMALPSLERTETGFEKQIAVNHFGHFYLTKLIVGKMANDNTSSGRIVVLASVAHDMGDIDFEDMHFEKGRSYRPYVSYGQSKSANILFAKSLADIYSGTHINAVSIHPGVIQTRLWNASLMNQLISSFVKNKSIPQGAATTVWACVAPRVSTDDLRGAYLSDCGPIPPSTEQCIDEKRVNRKKLWDLTDTQLNAALEKLGIN